MGAPAGRDHLPHAQAQQEALHGGYLPWGGIGPRPPKSALLRQTSGSFKPEVYGYYKSATQSQTGDVGDETKADGRASLLRSWGLWGLILIMGLGGTFGVYGLNQFFSPERFKHEEPPAPAPQVTPAPPPPPVSRAAQQVYQTEPSGPLMSPTWRVAGYLTGINDEGQTAWKSIGLQRPARETHQPDRPRAAPVDCRAAEAIAHQQVPILRGDSGYVLRHRWREGDTLDGSWSGYVID